MTKRTYKIATGFITAGLLLGVMAPGAFAATVTISGNGAFSTNKAKVKKTKTTVVLQSSKTSAYTSIKSKANTGGNSSSFNTGGTSNITTGNASNTTTVSVNGGSNSAVLPTCDVCDEEGSAINISGNGAFSNNTVKVNSTQTTVVGQSSTTCATTNISSTANTGNNSSSFNTGGDSTISTGDAVNTTTVTVTGGSNEVL